MRGGEEAGSQAIGAADRGAHSRRAAFSVRAGHDHRMTLQPCAVDAEHIEQFGQARQANAVAVFGKVKH
jgi:hypothetical protein